MLLCYKRSLCRTAKRPKMQLSHWTSWEKNVIHLPKLCYFYLIGLSWNHLLTLINFVLLGIWCSRRSYNNIHWMIFFRLSKETPRSSGSSVSGSPSSPPRSRGKRCPPRCNNRHLAAMTNRRRQVGYWPTILCSLNWGWTMISRSSSRHSSPRQTAVGIVTVNHSKGWQCHCYKITIHTY